MEIDEVSRERRNNSSVREGLGDDVSVHLRSEDGSICLQGLEALV